MNALKKKSLDIILQNQAIMGALWPVRSLKLINIAGFATALLLRMPR